MKLKKWQIVVIAVIAIGVVGAIIGGGSSEEDKPKDDKVVNTDDDNKKDDSKKDEGDLVGVVGKVLKVGKVEYTVDKVETSKKIGSEYLNKEAQETFLVLSITMKNNEDKPLTVLDSFFKLKKGDKTYDADSGAGVYLANESIIAKEINPEASLKGKIIFDVTKATADAKDLQLQVQTGVWGTEKGLINLH